MDISTLLGIVIVLAAIIMGIGAGIQAFIDLPSVYIVVGGSIAAVMVAHPKELSFKLFNIMISTIKEKKRDPISTIKTIVTFAEKARREGLLSLEENIAEIEDSFFKQGLQLVVDGTDPELLKTMLESELELLEEDFASQKAVLDSAGAYAPAFGMIGTLIGLIQMLKTLNNPDTLGPAMAKALITTFYGAVLANGFFLPMAEKIGGRAKRELLEKRMILEGILSIQAGDNPRIIEEKLKAYLSEKELQQYEAETQRAGV
ncbi:MAG TPA: motility protein A [Thermotogales bacterium]|nr:motility protein A [Thermotogales bacterium]